MGVARVLERSGECGAVNRGCGGVSCLLPYQRLEVRGKKLETVLLCLSKAVFSAVKSQRQEARRAF